MTYLDFDLASGWRGGTGPRLERCRKPCGADEGDRRCQIVVGLLMRVDYVLLEVVVLSGKNQTASLMMEIKKEIRRC